MEVPVVYPNLVASVSIAINKLSFVYFLDDLSIIHNLTQVNHVQITIDQRKTT